MLDIIHSHFWLVCFDISRLQLKLMKLCSWKKKTTTHEALSRRTPFSLAGSVFCMVCFSTGDDLASLLSPLSMLFQSFWLRLGM